MLLSDVDSNMVCFRLDSYSQETTVLCQIFGGYLQSRSEELKVYFFIACLLLKLYFMLAWLNFEFLGTGKLQCLNNLWAVLYNQNLK